MVLGCIRERRLIETRLVQNGMTDERLDKTERRQQCHTTPEVSDIAAPRDARSVMASLVSSGTTRGELLSVLASASIASELAGQLTAIGCPGSGPPHSWCQRTARGCHDARDLTKRQRISENSTDFAADCPNHDRPSDCGSTHAPCRRLPAASRESFAC